MRWGEERACSWNRWDGHTAAQMGSMSVLNSMKDADLETHDAVVVGEG